MNLQEKQRGLERGFYRYSWKLLIVMWAVYLIDIFMRYNIPTVIPILRKEYNWSAATVGWIDSAYLWAYAIMQVPWGYISERWLGAKWTVTIGTAIMTLASVIYAFKVDSVGLSIAARALIGVGAAAVWVPAYPVLARWFAPRKRGISTGIMATGGALGQFLGGALMPILILGSVSIFGLSQIQSGFLWSALPGVIMIFIVPFLVKNRPEEIGLVSLDVDKVKSDVDAAEDEPSFGYIMKRSWYPYLLSIVYAGYLGALYFVWTWFAAFLQHKYGIDIRAAGFLWAIASTVPALLSQPVGGILSDKLGRKKVASGALIGTAILSALFAVFDLISVPLWLTMVLVLIFAFFVNMWVVIWPFTTTMFPTKASAPIGGVMSMSAQLVGASAPVISGYFIDASSTYTHVFLLGSICAFVGFIASLFLKEHRVI
ncbi:MULTISPECIES: MFS transporter [Paenibacillus]|uniref:MFS transporter n=1 Tax=Paenibacillus TaxID=44249 RepID=UPI00114200AA|nr:MFS transporter [Paenibacillus sp. tmac-D7]